MVIFLSRKLPKSILIGQRLKNSTYKTPSKFYDLITFQDDMLIFCTLPRMEKSAL